MVSALFPSYQRYQSKNMMPQIEDLNENFYEISSPYLIYSLRKKLSKSVPVGYCSYFSVQFFFLNTAKVSDCIVKTLILKFIRLQPVFIQ